MADKETTKQTPPQPARVLRRTCNHCAASKRKCSGGVRCARCTITGVNCVYSFRQPMGRRPQQHDNRKALPTWPTLSVSPATGLSGLAESRFLSCFLQNVTPLCAVMNDKTVRDGLIHAMASQRDITEPFSVCDPSLDLLVGHEAAEGLGDEYRKGRALECAIFSSIAIGGLMLGCPVNDVARHLGFAQRCRDQLSGLKDRSAVSALILHALSHAFLGATQAPPGAKPSSSSEAEYRRSMDDAAAIDAELPNKDPLATAFMTYRKVVDCTAALTVGILNSSSLVNAVMGDKEGVRTEGARIAGERISKGCRKRTTTAAGTTTRANSPPQKAHPALVNSDGHFLAVRHAASIRGGGAGYIHVHDYLAFELGRLVQDGRAGGAVLAALGSLLIGVKAMTSQTDDLLPLAELVSTQYHQFPGFARYDKCTIAYNALAVFRLLGRREQYNSLRDIMVTRGGDNTLGNTPTFDECNPGVPICRKEVIATSAEMILNLGAGGSGVFDEVPGGGMNAPPSMGNVPV